MVIPTSFELLVFQLLFHLSWIYWYKNVNPDSSVLCFALRSGQTEWFSVQDSPLELELRLEIQLSISFQMFSWFLWCILILVFDYCIRDFFCTLFNSVIYIVASWITIFCFRCILLLCVCDSVIIYLLYILVLPNLN